MFKPLEDKKPYACPFCGITYRKVIPKGTVYLTCHCGAAFFVTPELGGSVHECPNHPGRQALGLCSDCYLGYCDDCLYVLTFDPFSRVRKLSGYEKTLYLCPRCLRKRKRRIEMTGLSLGIALMTIAVLLSPYLSLSPEGPVANWQIALIGYVVVAAFFGILFFAYGWLSIFIAEPSVRQRKNP